jgi:AcrR family transcriptional regulator
VSSAKQDTHARLLTVALRLFKKHGSGVRIEDVAREAGVTRQSVYLHFGSRAGLLVALAEHVDATGSLAQLIDRIVTAPNALAALDAFVALEADYNPEVYPLAMWLMRDRYTDEAARAAWENRMEARRSGTRQLVQWLERDGLLKPEWDIDTATDAIWALASLQVWEQLVIDRGWSKERYQQHLGQLLRATFVK